MIPNYQAVYATKGVELTEIHTDKRYMELCTLQSLEMSAMTARHAQERVKLALAIRKEDEDK